MACNSIFMIYIFLHVSYYPRTNTFPSKYTCIKTKMLPSWTNFTPLWFVWSTEAICVFHYSNRIILTKLVHKNRASILFLSFKVLQCTSMQEAATHRTRLCLGLGVTHVDTYGLAFLGSTGSPIYKATFWIIKIEVWKTINVMGNSIIWL